MTTQRLLAGLGRVPKITWVVLAMMMLFGFRSPTFFQLDNLLTIGRQGSVLVIIAMGSTLVILSGGVDLSPGTLMSLAGVVAVMSATVWGLPVPVGMLLGIAVGMGGGLINGVLVAQARMAPFIVTLGMLAMAQGLALVLTNGASQVAPQGFYRFIGNGQILGIPFLMILALLVFLLTAYILHQTAFGTYILAFGSNEEAAGRMGINTRRWKIALYALAGGLSGLGGLALSSRMSTAHPIVGLGWEFDAVAAVVLGGTALEGGRGGLIGTVIGVLMITALRNGLNLIGLPSNWQHAVTGFVLVLALVFEVVLSGRQLQFSTVRE